MTYRSKIREKFLEQRSHGHIDDADQFLFAYLDFAQHPQSLHDAQQESANGVFVEIGVEVSRLLTANHGRAQLGRNALQCCFDIRPQYFVGGKQFECRVGNEASMAAGEVGAQPGVVKQCLPHAFTRWRIGFKPLFQAGDRTVGITFERDDEQPVLIAE
ncbi:hypothetical protein [Caballeronia mineralivorans]|jgi:hypothetical protein|uniref:hypothetical protein n=1 Tax=Caballeronia mineralivorans TaxID=2010198 RepID=UPI002AFECA14|nr:hypothetical protein [Caballeronia mineralivorans]MDB5782403.1 hypothetical protein [Caballeronia mineralivorans]MEA3101086.1 hypothetical protein [Caballeronia mineralivorans]